MPRSPARCSRSRPRRPAPQNRGRGSMESPQPPPPDERITSTSPRRNGKSTPLPRISRYRSRASGIDAGRPGVCIVIGGPQKHRGPCPAQATVDAPGPRLLQCLVGVAPETCSRRLRQQLVLRSMARPPRCSPGPPESGTSSVLRTRTGTSTSIASAHIIAQLPMCVSIADMPSPSRSRPCHRR